jgi:hypothetical protein
MEIKDIQDVKRPPNLLAFSKSLSLDTTRQIVILSKIIGEVCSICSDNAHVEMLDEKDFDLGRITFTEHGVCPKCKQSPMQRIQRGYSKQISRAALEVGQRGGKNIGLALLTLYAELKLMTLVRDGVCVPVHKYYDLIEPVMLLNTWHSTSMAVAVNEYKDYVHEFREHSKQHKTYLSVLDYASNIIGKPLYELTESIFVDHRAGFTSMPEYNDIRRIKGKTRFFTAINDLAWSEDCDQKKLWNICDIGSKTMQMAARHTLSPADEVFGGTVVLLSSRCSRSDIFSAIDVDYKTYKASFASWEFNNAHPQFNRQALDVEYARDPVRAARDFENIV